MKSMLRRSSLTAVPPRQTDNAPDGTISSAEPDAPYAPSMAGSCCTMPWTRIRTNTKSARCFLISKTRKSSLPVLQHRYSNRKSTMKMGYKWGVVFVCGAVIRNRTLFVYGASDRPFAVATASLPELPERFLGNRTPTDRAVTIQR